ncbi:unnamed protein product [Hymenolepis diminuta]|uniref:Uncharacterized protein n=1 Tax=Hymenolepis diminuta TaxID=6216 RepID=A0A564ZD39_HYMDI|nr:unnamed protein product [Hymenolepis diminuta]
MHKICKTISKMKFKLSAKAVSLEDLVTDIQRKKEEPKKCFHSVRNSPSDSLDKEDLKVNLENPYSKENTYIYYSMDSVSPNLTANRRLSTPLSLPRTKSVNDSIPIEDIPLTDVYENHDRVMAILKTIMQKTIELEEKLAKVKHYPNLQLANVELDLATERVHAMKRNHEIIRRGMGIELRRTLKKSTRGKDHR